MASQRLDEICWFGMQPSRRIVASRVYAILNCVSGGHAAPSSGFGAQCRSCLQSFEPNCFKILLACTKQFLNLSLYVSRSIPLFWPSGAETCQNLLPLSLNVFAFYKSRAYLDPRYWKVKQTKTSLGVACHLESHPQVQASFWNVERG